MNTAAARVMRDSAADPPILNRIRNTRAFLRKLSLNAEKNWHQNSGAKRRDSRRGLEAAGDGSVMGPSLCQKARLRPASCIATGERYLDRIAQNNRGKYTGGGRHEY